MSEHDVEPCRYRPHPAHGSCPGWTRRQHGQRLMGQLRAIDPAPEPASPTRSEP